MTHTQDFEQDVIQRLARIEERLMPVADHETRIRKVENRQYLLAGTAAFIGGFVNHITGLFPWH